MENDKKIIQEFQEFINIEFNKKFEITQDNRSYKIALPVDEIPVVKSFMINNHRIVIFFNQNTTFINVNDDKIFTLLENEPGVFQAVIVNIPAKNNLNRFTIGREVIEEINEQESLNSNEIVNTKRKYLIHALYDMLKKEDGFQKFDLGVSV